MFEPIKNDTINAVAPKQQIGSKPDGGDKKIAIPLNKFENAPKQLKDALTEFDLDKNGTIDNSNKDGVNELSLLEKLAKAVGYEINTSEIAPENKPTKAPAPAYNKGPIVRTEDRKDENNIGYRAYLNSAGQEVERRQWGKVYSNIRTDGKACLETEETENSIGTTNISYYGNGQMSSSKTAWRKKGSQKVYLKEEYTYHQNGVQKSYKRVDSTISDGSNNCYSTYDTKGNTIKFIKGPEVK